MWNAAKYCCHCRCSHGVHSICTHTYQRWQSPVAVQEICSYFSYLYDIDDKAIEYRTDFRVGGRVLCSTYCVLAAFEWQTRLRRWKTCDYNCSKRVILDKCEEKCYLSYVLLLVYSDTFFFRSLPPCDGLRCCWYFCAAFSTCRTLSPIENRFKLPYQQTHMPLGHVVLGFAESSEPARFCFAQTQKLIYLDPAWI